MGLLQNLASALGDGGLQRLTSGQGNFADANSPDHQAMQSMIANADPSQLEKAFGLAAQQMDPQAYEQHVTPGVGGTNPLGNLGGGGLKMVAAALLSHLTSGGGHTLSGLLSRIPGLRTTDPNQMDENQVAALAHFTQQNHPDLFGRAAADVGKQQPGLLNSFLGKAGLAIGAAALASHFMKMERQ
jgi:hypothetical protein